MPYVKQLVDCTNDLPAILVGIVVAFLTILISVAVAIFGDKKDFELLDRNVILDHIIQARYLLVYLGLTFIPILFWNNSLEITRFIEIVIWGIGVYFIIKILVNSYKWMKGDKYNHRFEYLNNLKNTQDMEDVWKSVWQAENINFENEIKFFNIFNVRIVVDVKDNVKLFSKLLDDFNSNISKRSTSLLIWQANTIDQFLVWHRSIWIEDKQLADKANDEWIACSELLRTLTSIFEHIAIRSLKERSSYNLFKRLQSNVIQFKKVSDKYFNSLFDNFFRVFFNNISEAADKHDIWTHYFPKEWKVTKSNLESSEYIVSWFALNNYHEWAIDRIFKVSDEFDAPLDEATRELFPEVDPILWARILIFLYSPYGENRLRSVIDRPWNFGYFGRTKVYNVGGQDEALKDHLNEEINTYDLACYLFPNDFSRENLECYIGALESISYPEESAEHKKRERLKRLFDKMLDFVKVGESSK